MAFGHVKALEDTLDVWFEVHEKPVLKRLKDRSQKLFQLGDQLDLLVLAQTSSKLLNRIRATGQVEKDQIVDKAAGDNELARRDLQHVDARSRRTLRKSQSQ